MKSGAGDIHGLRSADARSPRESAHARLGVSAVYRGRPGVACYGLTRVPTPWGTGSLFILPNRWARKSRSTLRSLARRVLGRTLRHRVQPGTLPKSRFQARGVQGVEAAFASRTWGFDQADKSTWVSRRHFQLRAKPKQPPPRTRARSPNCS